MPDYDAGFKIAAAAGVARPESTPTLRSQLVIEGRAEAPVALTTWEKHNAHPS